ncbi:WhiB family transcriptional regulator [Actinokineospora sp. NBRC 105648]|uniref:WhiB family transcriptional regulator n=1 Tax=Actinokineospora sp. NBRC 105648 TaxID=3032206 RepID=UPI002554E56C|nr:WhiB family transcriptional regulator [Actinokineospora sp. NBRC 105648]
MAGFRNGTGAYRLISVPVEVLAAVVDRDGKCMGMAETDAPHDYVAAARSDRELAARMCQGCPVQDACLELEWRTSGPAGLGVWGALDESGRAAAHPLWLARRRRLGCH